ncbi:MAG TPA: cache domain-containing protein, partial [Candidatus Omnitrophota bacterium]|nr:cache domain-containing protein [Candidatus Omnitrophota bacterium]
MIDLQWVYFFYGLAFWVMGVLIFLMPKGKDLLNLSRDLRLIGGFGLLHGINEWVDLLIFRGGPLDVETLKIAGALLLPISFSFLVAFGVRIFFRNSPYLKYLWAFCLAVWASVYFYSSDFLISGIAARYFICIPGTFLTAAGLLLTLLKANKTLPRIVLWSVLSTAVIFSVYGILSGLIVPQAPFLTASFINYPNFNAVTGFPVQFFRMICAILLAIGFWGISGIYSLEMKKIRLRGGVKGKITAIIFLLAGSAVVLMFTITFIWLHGLMICTIEDHQMQMTRLLAQSVKQFLSNEVEQLTVHVRSPVWKGYVEQSNLKYRSMPSGTIDRMLQEMDREWVSGKSGNDWVEKILSNPMSARLAVLVSSDQEVAEIFLTDRYGGLVAASRKTTDFYQADEEWWQKTYANGRGHNRIGTYERDESSGAWSIPLSLPVRGSDGQVIGICKESLDVGVLFHVLDRFHFGKTGRAMLMDREGNLLFPREKNALDEGLLDEKGLRELTGKQTYLLWNERGKLMQGVRKVNSFVLLDYPLLLQNGIVWYIAVCQDANEVFSPLFVVQIGLSMFLMIVLSGITIAGFLVGKRFSRPIQELRVATEAIMAGNWEFENKVKTGDEIEDLSNAFCRMTAQLKAMYENLEKKVQEKTLELSMKVQELEDTKQAILNVLDD